jgi:dipeptidase E
MTLFLTSSGLSAENIGYLQSLIPVHTEGKVLKVAYIATATNGELGKKITEIDPEDRPTWLQEDFRKLEPLDFTVTFINLEDENEETIVPKFSGFDVVYVQGGNTFYLMHYANVSGFKKHIHEILKDKIYFGISAGSIIAGPDISLAGWEGADKNDIGLEDMSGLSLVDFCIMPHWDGSLAQESKIYPYEIKYIKDGEYIIQK